MARRVISGKEVAEIEMRLALGQSQTDIAIAVGVSQGTVYNVKKGLVNRKILTNKEDRTLVENVRAVVDDALGRRGFFEKLAADPTVQANLEANDIVQAQRKKREEDEERFIKAQEEEARLLREQEQQALNLERKRGRK